MVKFQSARILNEKFSVKAAFYKLEVRGRGHNCCSVKKMYRNDSANKEADALIILSNPRSCLPVDAPVLYELNPANVEALPMQKIRAYHTEHQLMRLMEQMDWNLLAIVHLTDIQATDRIELQHDLYYMTYNKDTQHSIFSAERIKEVTRLIAPQTKVIAGWGKQEKLEQQASNALNAFAEKVHLYGLPNKVGPYYYYHPYPFTQLKRMEWLQQMALQLSSDGG